MDARWRTHSKGKRAQLCYQNNALVDEHGFIVARTLTHASDGDWQVVAPLLDTLPYQPESVCADTGYSAGALRQVLAERGIRAHIPVRPHQERNMLMLGGFTYHGDHLICPEGKDLHRRAFLRQDLTYQYVARQKDCSACPARAACLPPRQKRRFVALSMHYPLFLKAREQNQASEYKIEMRKRKIFAEGAFASLDRLGWARARLRGLGKVDCEGFLSALAHNILKAVRRFLPQLTGGIVPAAAS